MIRSIVGHPAVSGQSAPRERTSLGTSGTTKNSKEEEEKVPGGRISSHAPSGISLGHAGQVTRATLHMAEGCGEEQTLTKQGKSDKGTCKRELGQLSRPKETDNATPPNLFT